MRARIPTTLVVAAALAIPLAFDPASVRPFVGPKLAAALALGSLVPAAAIGARSLGRLRALDLGAFTLHVAALAAATALSLRPAVSLAGDFHRGMGLATRLSLVALALLAGSVVAGRRAALRPAGARPAAARSAAARPAAARPAAALPVLRAALAACAAVALHTLAQAFGLDPVVDPGALLATSRAGVVELRPVATLGHSNFVGHLLLFGTGAAAALAGAETRPAARAAALAGGALAATGVLASGSRGAWVALAVQLAALAAAAPAAYAATPGRPGRAAPVAAALGALALAAAIGASPIGEQVAARASAFRADGMTGSGRTLLWRDALPMVARYAAHGCGPEAFALAFLPYESASLERAEPYALYDSAHNVLLDAAILSGVAGAASVLALAAAAAAALAAAARAAPPGPSRAVALGVALALLGYLVGGLFVFDTVATAFYFYLFVAVACGLGARAVGHGAGEGAREERARGAAPREPLPAVRAAAAAAALLAAGTLLWPRVATALRADRQMARAVERSAAGDLAGAVVYGRASVANGEALGPVPELRHMLARICATAGDASRYPTPEEAVYLEAGLGELARALEHSTTPHLLRAEAADLDLRFARVDAAAASLREAIEIAPTFWPARQRLARLLLALGRAEEAYREASAAADLNPESAEARELVERASRALGR